MASAVEGVSCPQVRGKAPLKLVPVLGQTANAAMAFAYTYSLGKACCWYFGEMKNGHVPSPQELDKVWGEQLQQARSVAHPDEGQLQQPSIVLTGKRLTCAIRLYQVQFPRKRHYLTRLFTPGVHLAVAFLSGNA